MNETKYETTPRGKGPHQASAKLYFQRSITPKPNKQLHPRPRLRDWKKASVHQNDQTQLQKFVPGYLDSAKQYLPSYAVRGLAGPC